VIVGAAKLPAGITQIAGFLLADAAVRSRGWPDPIAFEY